jgi:diaminopimelate decarboxylase
MADAFAVEVHAGLGVDADAVNVGGGHGADTSER